MVLWTKKLDEFFSCLNDRIPQKLLIMIQDLNNKQFLHVGGFHNTHEIFQFLGNLENAARAADDYLSIVEKYYERALPLVNKYYAAGADSSAEEELRKGMVGVIAGFKLPAPKGFNQIKNQAGQVVFASPDKRIILESYDRCLADHDSLKIKCYEGLGFYTATNPDGKAVTLTLSVHVLSGFDILQGFCNFNQGFHTGFLIFSS